MAPRRKRLIIYAICLGITVISMYAVCRSIEHADVTIDDSNREVQGSMTSSDNSSQSSQNTNSDTSFIYKSVKNSEPNFKDYLTLTNLRYNIADSSKTSTETKTWFENLFRTGYGLEPYTTEQGEKAWIENGLVYRPWRRPDPSTMHKTHPSPYFTEYESYMPFNEELFFEGRQPDPRYKTNKKIILWHTLTRYTAPMNKLLPMNLCPEFPCQITTNRDYLHSSSAVIFTAQLMKSMPPKRKDPNQMFILHNHEPPHGSNFRDTTLYRPEWKHAFNWTMTYRLDSDFVVPYGIVRKRPTPVVKDYEAIVGKKTKMAAWLVSNCRTTSHRMNYITELQKYINVDIYGACGTFKCPHEEQRKCTDIITTEYKFYIAFESTFCPDYISEKLFHYLTMDTITVARGSNEYFQHIPSEIFINTVNFPSPKELAVRIKYLNENDDAYIAMLKEKNKYMSLMEGLPVRNPNGYIRFIAYRFEAVSLCRVCQQLWNLDRHRKSLANSHDWFNSKKCYKPDDLHF